MAPLSQEDDVRRNFWPKVKASLARLPFAEELVAAYYCAFDPATPLRVKGILVAALAYFILPFDVVPDFLIGLGFTDDAAVLLGALSAIRVHMNQSHRDKAKETLDRLKAETIDASPV
jgi:uncharacterized membrane protein YkvA (DUF1232 family)